MGNTKNNNFMLKTMFKDNEFTPDDVAKGLLLFLIFETAVSLVYQLVYFIGLRLNALSYVFNVILDLCFLLTVYLVAKNKKVNAIKQIKVEKAPSLLMSVVCVAVSVVCIFGFSGLTNCFLQALYNVGYSSVSGDIVVADWGHYILYTICICVLPAICEEVLFRGLIFTGLKKISTTVGVFGSAFIFMIMHGSPDQTVHQFILGVILACAFLITNNLWVSILIHFFNNFIAVSFSFFAYGDSSSETVDSVVDTYLGQYFLYALISAVIASAIIYLLFKALSKLCNKKSESAVVTDNGTIDSEINSHLINSEDYSVEVTDVNGENRQKIYTSSKDLQNKFSKQGKFILWVGIVWLALEWFIAFVSGFSII